VFAIWEPILPTDFSSPGSGVLDRLSDAKVRQYWDKSHLFAAQLARRLKSDPEHPQPRCCKEGSVDWDEVAVYRQDARWGDQLPRAAFLNGPVIQSLDFADVVAELQLKKAGSKLTSPN